MNLRIVILIIIVVHVVDIIIKIFLSYFLNRLKSIIRLREILIYLNRQELTENELYSQNGLLKMEFEDIFILNIILEVDFQVIVEVVYL